MGTGVQPICTQCNHTFTTIYLGGGFRDYGTVCKVPVPCYDCGKLMELNLLRKEIRCSSCSKQVEPFGEIVSEEMEESDDVRFSWSLDFEHRYQLRDKDYSCPKCKQPHLRFFDGMITMYD